MTRADDDREETIQRLTHRIAELEACIAGARPAPGRAQASAPSRALPPIATQGPQRLGELDRRWKSSQDLIWELSSDLFVVAELSSTRIVDVNPAWTEVLGWTADELVSRPMLDLIHPADVAGAVDKLGDLNEGRRTYRYETRYSRKDGAYRTISWTAVPDEGLIHAIGRDVTAERQATESLALSQEALRQAQKMEAVGQLTGGIAHDFNNLLTVISTSIQLLRRPNVSEERRTRFMESIANAVARAAKLTGQLLAFARRQALQPVVFDAASNVAAIADMISTLVGARITVEAVACQAACAVDADPGQFDTAIINMAVNARDAMGGQGRLSIETQRVGAIPAVRAHAAVRGEFVAVSVSDTGSGIAPEQLDRVFEPFFTTKAVGHGTGLGLSQVFGFAKQSGGDVRVRSIVGQGTTFTLYLPLARRAADPQNAAPADDLACASVGGHVLVVEDNAEVAASVEATLTELGYEVELAVGADQALRILAADASRFCAVFSDVVMAGMDGIELAREIRRLYDPLPVVLSSGYSHVLASGVNLGFSLLPKPYSVEALARSIRDAVSGTESRLEKPPLRDSEADERADFEELARLAELEALGVLDTPAEPAYDDLTRLAATLFDAPIALISLIDSERQWFKARVGLEVAQTPREHAFCAHAIERPHEVMVVPDATKDARFAANPLVTGDPNIRFYAGAPLVLPSGRSIGTICVIDTVARQESAEHLDALAVIARQIAERLEAGKAGGDS